MSMEDSTDQGDEFSCSFLKRGAESWDLNDRGSEFHRREVQKLNALDPVAALTLGTFKSVPWFDLSPRKARGGGTPCV